MASFRPLLSVQHRPFEGKYERRTVTSMTATINIKMDAAALRRDAHGGREGYGKRSESVRQCQTVAMNARGQMTQLLS